eukprot:3679467-Amphidinium_carterae.1
MRRAQSRNMTVVASIVHDACVPALVVLPICAYECRLHCGIVPRERSTVVEGSCHILSWKKCSMSAWSIHLRAEQWNEQKLKERIKNAKIHRNSKLTR